MDAKGMHALALLSSQSPTGARSDWLTRTLEGGEENVIKRSEEKISAEEMENLLLAHPGGFNAAGVEMPNPVLGERSCTRVILQPGASLPFPELMAFLQTKQISKFNLSEPVEMVESYPLTSVGNVSRKDLRGDTARKLEAEARAQARPPAVEITRFGKTSKLPVSGGGSGLPGCDGGPRPY